MKMTRGLAAALALLLASFSPGLAQAQADRPMEGLLVVYGVLAPSREGDVDRREQVFFSIPAGLRDRLYLRIYDPEVHGDGDFIYGSSANSGTTFRLFGGDGAFSQSELPQPVADGARAEERGSDDPVTGPGKLLKEDSWGNDPATDGRWVNLAVLKASQGEVIGDRAYFRLDVQGSGGDDGNGFSMAVSQSRDRNLPPDGLEMVNYMPTVRWSRGHPATQVWFTRETDGPFTVQSFDAANGELALVTDYEDLGVRVSGQNFWTSDTVNSTETNLALSLLGGFETPNDVTLALFDAAGDPIPLQMPPRRAPVPSRPTATGTGSPLADCRSVAFDGSQSTGQIPLSYLWEFGDGAQSDQPVIAHRYANPGRYDARLRVLEQGVRPGRGDQVPVPVHVRNAPVAVPGSDTTVAPGQVLTFDGTASVASDSPITRYRWNFGDGSSAEGPKALKSYGQPGQYRAVLRVEDDSAHPCNFGVDTRQIIVNFAPVAEAGTDQSAIVGAPVRFSAAASYDVDGLIETYVWDMGDGTELSGANVTHIYRGSGRYPVILQVTDDSGVANNTATDRMHVAVNAPPVPRFTIPPRPVSVSEVAMMDASASTDDDGQIVSYVWDFGDGAMGEGQQVSYAWTKAGRFEVVLTVIDNSGTASALQSLTIPVVVDAAPVADAGPDQYVTASVVTFDGRGSNDAEGGISTYEWQFGDGSTATGPTPSHAYLRPGTYEVALVVRDESGAPLNSDRDTMQLVINETPIADAGPPQTVAPGEEIIVSGRASVDPDGEIAEFLWTFPDGSTARGLRAAHRIDTPGLHRIRLTVSDNFPGGAAEDDSEVLITVNAAPVAVAGADILIAPGDTVTFDAGQSFDPDGRLVNYRWEFDDLGAPLESAKVERAYVTPGVWSAQLVVSDDSGVANGVASDDMTIRVNSSPEAEAGPPVETDRLFVELDASGSVDADGDALIYRWDMGDGSPPVYGQQVTHVFERHGVFPVTLQVDDGTGLANARSVDATTVTINARPLALAGGNRDVCSGEPILFDASGSSDPDGGLLQYSWDFGDGSNSDLVNPTKTYEVPGIYPVTLRVRNESGTQHGTAVDRIAALVREGPIASAGEDRTVCTNQQVRFDGSGSTDADGAVNAFAWTFGDGGTASGETPVYVFKRPGTYAVTLTITGDARGACSPLDTDVASIEVVAAPELAILGAERIASGLSAEFAAGLSDLGAASVLTHRWSFGDGTTAEGAEVSHTFDQPGVYLVRLTTELTGGNKGCSVLETQRNIVVNARPQPFIDGPAMVAAGQAVTYDASMSADPDGAITDFHWDFGDGETAGGVLAAHSFAKAGTYEVTLTVTDDAGVKNSKVALTQTVQVNPPPVAALKQPLPVCPAEDSEWVAAAGPNTNVSWVFGDGTAKTGASVRHAFARAGVFPVLAVLDDGAGLPNSRRSEEVYVRVNAAPTALAGPDQVVCPGDVVVLDAGGSGDIDGQITNWTWAFSDGVTLEGARVERVFDAAGAVTVTLTVTDDSGAKLCGSSQDTAGILVNAPPLVNAGPDRTVPVGAAHDVVRFDASGASDPDGHGLRVGWAFGDGAEATGAIARHRYSTAGEYTVMVTARDQTGLSCGIATDTAIVTAQPRE